jgi:hypothetical protein
MLTRRMIGKETILAALRAKLSGGSSDIDYNHYHRCSPDGDRLKEYRGKDVTINVLDLRPHPGYTSSRICTYEVLADGIPYAKRCCESIWSHTDWHLSARHLLIALDDLPTYQFNSTTVNITGESAISTMVNPASITR